MSASTDDFVSRVESLLAQRRRRVPVQYILGEWDFRNITLKMRAPVLIPRPETEQLVGHVLASLLASGNVSDPLWFLDVGCGSGAISIALLNECTKLRGVAIDVSAEAVTLTKENAIMCNVHERLNVIQTSVGDISADTFGGRLFDILVCNPPYVSSHAMQWLDPEVLWFEDHRALDGGEDGLKVAAQVLEASQRVVKRGGHIWLELGADQDLRQLIEQNSQWQTSLFQTYSDFADRITFHHLVK